MFGISKEPGVVHNLADRPLEEVHFSPRVKIVEHHNGYEIAIGNLRFQYGELKDFYTHVSVYDRDAVEKFLDRATSKFWRSDKEEAKYQQFLSFDILSSRKQYADPKTPKEQMMTGIQICESLLLAREFFKRNRNWRKDYMLLGGETNPAMAEFLQRMGMQVNVYDAVEAGRKMVLFEMDKFVHRSTRELLKSKIAERQVILQKRYGINFIVDPIDQASLATRPSPQTRIRSLFTRKPK